HAGGGSAVASHAGAGSAVAPHAGGGSAVAPHAGDDDGPGPRAWSGEAGEELVAPAGWPEDVVRRTGRISAADLPDVQRMRSTNRRRRVPTPRPPSRRPAGQEPAPSWPGRLPAPSPATVPPHPLPAELVAADGSPVLLSAPDLLSAPPEHIVVDGGRPQRVPGWAGPWPVQQRWWASGGSGASRLQVTVDDGEALLLLARGGRWWLIGRYD
ncbi:MAG TPA: hypothetical protein VD903_00055, partial [Pseudonocardia sp.]|nr:hypothetical protein [Pseudonocardia sp.]